MYQGWIIVEECDPAYKPQVLVEWNEGSERKREYMKARGDSGAAEVVEWWDKKLGRPCVLEATIRGMYRVK